MLILAIDTSSNVATIALVEEGNMLAQYSVNHKKTHSQTIMPMIDEMLNRTEISIDSIGAIAVSAGPGSFTGLRIGSATAKGLALIRDIPIIEIPTMEGMAYNLFGYKGYICPIMDARRNQVYSGIYHFEEGKLKCDMPQCQIDIDELIDNINEKYNHIIFLGDGVKVYKEKINEKVTIVKEFALNHMTIQSAASVGMIALEYYNEGKYINADMHQPDYLRKSQAEREMEEKIKNNSGAIM